MSNERLDTYKRHSQMAKEIAQKFGANQQAIYAIDRVLDDVRTALQGLVSAETPGFKDSDAYRAGSALLERLERR